MKDVLVLNNAYQPISIISWDKAMTLILGEFDKIKVNVVAFYEDEEVHTIKEAFLLPAVIRIRDYVKPKFNNKKVSKELLLRRDNNQCQYCGTVLSKKQATIDHVLPKSRGGRNTWTNLVISCYNCNNYKGDYTPAEAGMRLMKEPKTPSAINGGKIYKEWEPYL